MIVREWMAHHLGMSLLAILNLLQGNIVQQWFHANPLVQSSELLLNELPARRAVLSAMVKGSPSIRAAPASPPPATITEGMEETRAGMGF